MSTLKNCSSEKLLFLYALELDIYTLIRVTTLPCGFASASIEIEKGRALDLRRRSPNHTAEVSSRVLGQEKTPDRHHLHLRFFVLEIGLGKMG